VPRQIYAEGGHAEAVGEGQLTQLMFQGILYLSAIAEVVTRGYCRSSLKMAFRNVLDVLARVGCGVCARADSSAPRQGTSR